MKTVYIAHPIAGDVAGNITKVLDILKRETTRDVCPVAPYLVALQYLNDGDDEQRALGMEMNEEFFRRKFVDELWCYGFSAGVRREIELASETGIPIVLKLDTDVDVRIVRSSVNVRIGQMLFPSVRFERRAAE